MKMKKIIKKGRDLLLIPFRFARASVKKKYIGLCVQHAVIVVLVLRLRYDKLICLFCKVGCHHVMSNQINCKKEIKWICEEK